MAFPVPSVTICDSVSRVLVQHDAFSVNEATKADLARSMIASACANHFLSFLFMAFSFTLQAMRLENTNLNGIGLRTRAKFNVHSMVDIVAEEHPSTSMVIAAPLRTRGIFAYDTSSSWHCVDRIRGVNHSLDNVFPRHSFGS